MKETLVLCTQFYPFTDYDRYADVEFESLFKAFKRVYIISTEKDSPITRQLPPHVKVIRFLPEILPIDKLFSIRFLFNYLFYNELWLVMRQYKKRLSFRLLKEILLYMTEGYAYHLLLKKLVYHEKLDPGNMVIYSYWMLSHNFGACLLKRKNNKVLVFSRAHGFDLYFERNALHYLPFRKICFEGMDALFFISADGRNYFKKVHHIAASREKNLHVNRLGIQNTRPEPVHAKNPGRLRIVSNSWLRDFKRVDMIIDVLAQLQGIDIEWTHFGGNSGDLDYFNRFVAKAEMLLKPLSHISYQLKGSTPLHEIFEYYQSHEVDVFLHLSAYEGLPVSMMEVMSFGIPVISTNVGGVSEIVKDMYNGILLSAHPSLDEVCAALKKVSDLDAERNVAMSKNAYKTWSSDFNAEKNSQQLLEDMKSYMPSEN